MNLSLPEALSRESLGKLATRDATVIFSCFGRYCPYSAYAAAKARLWGYTQVNRFPGGFPEWVAAGYPVESGSGSGTSRITAR
jgi:3-mercaptopyruvate sulfurtransferase SseA